MSIGEALVGGIALPALAMVTTMLLKRAGTPLRSPEDWAFAFELLVAAVTLAGTLSVRAVSEFNHADRGSAAARLAVDRLYVAGGLTLGVFFFALCLADWLRGRHSTYEVERLPPGPPGREQVAHLATADASSTNRLAGVILCATYPVCVLLPKVIG